MLEFLEGFLLGLAGLVPYLHTNLILQFLGSAPLAFVSALAASHAVFEVFPAVLFAVPSQAHSIAALPAHQLAQQGKAFMAFRISLYSMFYGLVAALAFFPFYYLAAPAAYAAFKPFAGWVLLALVVAFLATERNKVAGLLVFALSSGLGWFTFNSPLIAEPLFPLLTGLFAVPALLYSVGAQWPKPDESETVEPDRRLVIAGAFLGCFSPFLPAVNPALIAAAAFLFLESSPIGFIAFSSALAASKIFYDAVSSQLIGVARSGAAVALAAEPVKSPFIVASATAAGLAAAVALALLFYKPAARALSRLRLRYFNWFFLAFLAFANFLLGGWEALFVLGAASCVGVACVASGARRSACMGSLIAPSLAYFFLLA
ncbi:hypothetical protein COX86_01960 [Candidatus Micrarchaeota archaeon CG_4_10_14_0_2_um_filter_60_11]|nr:MAG: hypothetical protein AUJ16_04565 [Candidatus Micrarchaeota archaeon CG1_02_60_51]PIN96381.1 MAG: hypothetical protein COU39_01375 [Candidatus Micrarchaeota archaeon CG10_big_fil_rev_8_21_14_0_10_60_32]PIO02047.1 MAG: hypothetical protein COT58_01965 [Candidatus Micrarchaeota archaeon CG09_land_8_20_14_0_10_60_16]PIZ90993.1 MAG: hypothetical protein COX86_01960 [Candidatus Micrarchaeota archaeon CG_4_10_14_0_2_um_filter_60_11]